LGQQCEQAKQRKSALPNIRTFAPYSDFVFFLLLLLFFLLCFLSLFFRSTEQEHKQVSAHWDLFVQNEEHALQTHAKFQIMVAADYGFFLYGAALWY
jgi:hypothetical protein